MSAQLADTLERGADELGVALTHAQVTTLLEFVALLERWNRAYNLTAVRDPLQMVSRHLLDSLSIMRFICGKTLLDVGSGAGLPGLVLAIAMPKLEVTLLDPALKRTRFLAHASRELGLANVTVERARKLAQPRTGPLQRRLWGLWSCRCVPKADSVFNMRAV